MVLHLHTELTSVVDSCFAALQPCRYAETFVRGFLPYLLRGCHCSVNVDNGSIFNVSVSIVPIFCGNDSYMHSELIIRVSCFQVRHAIDTRCFRHRMVRL